MTSIVNLFGLEPVEARNFSKVIPLSNPDPSLIYGIELEIEDANEEWSTPSFKVTRDGSLRNGGLEFISKPMTYSNMLYAINKFFEKVRISSLSYSERTSVHVHTNCQDLTIPQLKSVLVLYQVFEDLFFKWIGHERDKNIFCVPWSQTQITFSILDDIESFIKLSSIERNKYTALNLVPLKTLGTIEWRHMYGTNDVKRISTWMEIIGHLFRIAKTYEYGQVLQRCVNLNTSSQYDLIMDWVFEDLSPLLKYNNFKQIIENGVLTLKYSILKPPNKKILFRNLLHEFVQDIPVDAPTFYQDFVITEPVVRNF